MSVVIFIFSALVILASVWLLFVDCAEPFGVMGIFLLPGLFFGAPYYNLNSDVHKVITEYEYIELEEKYISDLRNQLDNFPSFDIALLNADSPVATITNNLHEAQKTLRERKVSILDAKRGIKARENGLTAYIFWFYSDELLEEAGV